jgi:hypothetical protein
MRGVQITLSDVGEQVALKVPAELDGGAVWTATATYHELVPLPLVATGGAVLRLEFMSGEVLEIRGRDIRIEPVGGDARFLEELPGAPS